MGLNSLSAGIGVSYHLTPFSTQGGYVFGYIGDGYNVCLEGTHMAV